MKLTKIAILAAIAFAVTGCSTNTPTKPTETWSAGACTAKKPGVTLSIDYLGKVTTRCALNYSGNGWELFAAAGIKVQGTAKYPTAFACKINDEPKTANCDDSAMSSAYWGYFVSINGSWDYAATGASEHKSKCGDAEGWVYMETEKTVSHLPPFNQFSCN